MDHVPLLEVSQLSHSLFISFSTLEEVESHSNFGFVDVSVFNLDKFKAWCAFSRWSQGSWNIELIKVNTTKEVSQGLVVSQSDEAAGSIVSFVSEEERTIVKWLNCTLGSIPVQKVVELPGFEVVSLGN